MLFQLSETDLLVIDHLADGGQSLARVVQELRERGKQMETPQVVSALTRLMDMELVRCSRFPGDPTSMPASTDALLHHIEILPQEDRWLELTERGQSVWEAWRQMLKG